MMINAKVHGKSYLLKIKRNFENDFKNENQRWKEELHDCEKIVS